MSEPLVAFIFGSLTEAPRTRGKPLRDELEGYWSARRGDYRVIYRLDDHELLVLVVTWLTAVTPTVHADRLAPT